MALTLYLHPLSSYCWKTLIALYENETPFEGVSIDLGDAESRDKLARLWTFSKFPVLRDEARSTTVPESTIIIEYVAQHYPGRASLLPTDPDAAIQTRFYDRFFDLYVHNPMQTIVGDKIRPDDSRDPLGVKQARSTITTAYDRIEEDMATRQFAVGNSFTMADCAATPALYYANRVQPIGDARPHTTAYLQRLMARPAFKRVFHEAEPYLAMFPG